MAAAQSLAITHEPAVLDCFTQPKHGGQFGGLQLFDDPAAQIEQKKKSSGNTITASAPALRIPSKAVSMLSGWAIGNVTSFKLNSRAAFSMSRRNTLWTGLFGLNSTAIEAAFGAVSCNS